MMGLLWVQRARRTYDIYVDCSEGQECGACFDLHARWGEWWGWLGLPYNEPSR
jgi:hypothetical protein